MPKIFARAKIKILRTCEVLGIFRKMIKSSHVRRFSEWPKATESEHSMAVSSAPTPDARPPAKAACQTDGAQKGTDGDDEDDSARQQMMTIIVAAAVVIVAPTTPVVPCCRTVSGESAGARKGASKISKLW